MKSTIESTHSDVVELLASIVDALPSGVIVFDKDLRVITVNETVRRLLKLKSKQDLNGKGIHDVNPNVTADRLEVYRQVLRTGQPQIIVDEVDHAVTGRRLWQIQAIKVGECLATISEDVTDKDAYHQLALQTVQLRKLKQEIEELKSKLP
jgi:PAS domain-containing protein